MPYQINTHLYRFLVHCAYIEYAAVFVENEYDTAWIAGICRRAIDDGVFSALLAPPGAVGKFNGACNVVLLQVVAYVWRDLRL